MTLDQLEALITIAESGSFRAAAEKLNKAQSAISYSIKNLEQELNLELFDRKSYRPSLTPSGQQFLEKTKPLLKDLEALKLFASTLNSGVEPVLRVCISNLIPLDIFLDFFKSLQTQFPLTQLRLEISSLKGPLEAVSECRAELALTELDPPMGPFESRPSGNIELFPVCAPNYLPQLDDKNWSASELSSYTQIIVSDSPSTKSQSTAGVLEGGNSWRVTDFHTKKAFLLSGLGWGNMPKHMIENELKNQSLRRISFGKPIYRELKLIRASHREMGPVEKFFWENLPAL